MRLPIIALLVSALSCFYFAGYAQESPAYSKLYSMPDRLFSGLQSKLEKTGHQIDKHTNKYLERLERQEKKLRNKLRKTDSVKAAELFWDIEMRYSRMRQQLQDSSAEISNYGSIYNAHLDSLNTAFKFIKQAGNTPDAIKLKLDPVLNNYKELQGTLSAAEKIKIMLKERQQQLKEQLAHTPLAREFKKFQKEVYYYRSQIDEYKRTLSDPAKLQAKLLQLANTIPAFKNFFSKHSELAALFRVPENYGSMASLQGLQTRYAVQGLIDQRIAAGGPGAQQIVQQNLASAQAQLQQLKDKMKQLGNGGGDVDMPGFKPNNQRTKSFLQRLEFGTNVQTQKAQYYFPATSDLGLSVGYKLNDKSIIGLGASYKLGLGNGWNNIKLTHQGVGLRSFLDWKLKGSFYVSGGYEQNYKAVFNTIAQLKDLNAWQQSALLGISKKYRVSKKFKGNIQLLYDFLHAKHLPETQPVIFRMGYTF